MAVDCQASSAPLPRTPANSCGSAQLSCQARNCLSRSLPHVRYRTGRIMRPRNCPGSKET
eukprot:7603443-Alexandrium_andersonii.AAC.1